MTSTSLTIAAVSKELASAAETAAPISHPALKHALKTTQLHAAWATRAMGNASATAQVFAMGVDSETVKEIVDMQQAVWERIWALQKTWARDWQRWVQYAEQVKGANTMSKLVEREANIAAQFTQLLSNQATDWVGLQENVDVDYSYWINEKLEEKRKVRAAVSN